MAVFDAGTIERFWSKVDKSAGPDACWPWTGGVTRGANRVRGMFYVNGKAALAHRLSAILTYGKPMQGQVTMHSCDNPICCNPRHLAWGTQKKNMEDCSLRKRASGQIKSHCVHGHRYSDENCRIRPNGRRACRECQKIRMRNDREKKSRIAAKTGLDLATVTAVLDAREGE